MDDLITRLRAYPTGELGILMSDAAAQIRRLESLVSAQDAQMQLIAQEREALRADAERYRFLRSRPASVEPGRIDVVYWSALDESANEGEGLRGDELDARIDAALAAASEGRS